MKRVVILFICLMLTGCGDTVYQETGTNNKATINSVIVTDGTVSSEIISVTEKELSPDKNQISIDVAISVTNTSLSDAYTTATLNGVTQGGLKVISIPFTSRLKPGETTILEMTAGIGSGAYALIKEWQMSEVSHVQLTPTIVAPEKELNGKYLLAGAGSTTRDINIGIVSVSTAGTSIYNVESLLTIQNGTWIQKIEEDISPQFSQLMTLERTGNYTLNNNLVLIGDKAWPYQINGDKLIVTYPELCSGTFCYSTSITWQKVSDLI